ncbi:MAG: hypothetical protein HGB23_01860 [Chlorobiaceae bacterium]|nr:hypothetical protein [Chlorobiaceae bacterium]
MVDNFKVINNFILEDPTWMWDEWNFFFYFDDICDFFKSHEDDFKSIVDQSDVICSLGKSGMVFATYLSVITRKPLVVFSVGEFIHQGAYVIGFTKSEDQIVKGKKLLVVDSHIRSGNTIKMMGNYIAHNDVEDVKWLTIMDCRSAKKREEMHKYDIRSICDFFPDIRNQVIKVTDDEFLLEDESFWMKKEEYWLGRDSIKLKFSNQDSSDKEIAEKQEKINYFDITLFDKSSNKYFIPLHCIKNSEYFGRMIGYFYDTLTQDEIDVDKKYLILPLTLGALPIAVSLAYSFYHSGCAVRFLFPLFRTEKYFRKKLDEVADYTVIIIDDVITTGGLIYAFYDKYLRDVFTDVNLIAPLKLKIGSNSDAKYAKYFYNVSKCIIDNGGKVIVGQVPF